MDEEKKKIVDKIIKCLDLANNEAATVGEAASAMERIGQMLHKYDISMDQVEEVKNGNGNGKKSSVEQVIINGSSERKRTWESALAQSIATTFDCRTINREWSNWQIIFVGVKGDIETSLYFYRYLTRWVGKKSEVWKKQADRTNYCFGAISTIGSRLDSLYKGKMKEAEVTGTMALVVKKKEEVNQFIAQEFPFLTKGKAVRLNGSAEAYNRGLADGHLAPLSRPVRGGNNYTAIGG